MTKDNRASEDALAALHGALARTMKDKLANLDSLTAADLGVIRQFLKDNGITAVPAKGSDFGNLLDNLPSFDSDEDFLQ